MSEHMSLLKKSLDKFSLDLYHTIASDPATVNKNVFLSPLSISSALLLVYLGAKETTKKEIEAALHLEEHFGANKDAVFNAYEEVLRIFVPAVGNDGRPAYSLALANKAYVQNGLKLKPEYVSTITKSLKSEVGQVDFQKNTEGARTEVNQWVEKQTHNKIQNLLAPGSVNSATLLVLVNAIYFKADWMNKFDEKETQKAPFYNIGGREVQVDLMALTSGKLKKYDYYDNFEGNQDGSSLPPFQMLGIPYKEHEMSMLIFLPRDKAGLKDFEKALTAETLGIIHGNSGSRKAKVWLPRFKLEETYDLLTILEKSGIKKLFSAQADLSGMSETSLSVSSAVHKAFVEVNEEGTEAAAATAMMMTRMMVIEDPPVEFRADHPFLFAIRHETSGLISFVGRVAQL